MSNFERLGGRLLLSCLCLLRVCGWGCVLALLSSRLPLCIPQPTLMPSCPPSVTDALLPRCLPMPPLDPVASLLQAACGHPHV
jgi:hypothetical protein